MKPVHPSRMLVGLAVCALVTAGCGNEPSARPAPDAETVLRAQVGKRWELVRLGDIEIPPPPHGTPPDSLGADLVPGRRPTLTFTRDSLGQLRVGGRSFCNGWGGPAAVRGDSLRIREIVSTAVGCDGPDSLETRYFRALGQSRRFEVDSLSLRMSAAHGTALLFESAER